MANSSELLAYKLISNTEGKDVRLEKRGYIDGKVARVQVIHLTKLELQHIVEGISG